MPAPAPPRCPQTTPETGQPREAAQTGSPRQTPGSGAGRWGRPGTGPAGHQLCWPRSLASASCPDLLREFVPVEPGPGREPQSGEWSPSPVDPPPRRPVSFSEQTASFRTMLILNVQEETGDSHRLPHGDKYLDTESRGGPNPGATAEVSGNAPTGSQHKHRSDSVEFCKTTMCCHFNSL